MKSSYVILYTNLNTEDKAQTENFLKKNKIPFLSREHSLYAAQSRVPQIWLQLAKTPSFFSGKPKLSLNLDNDEVIHQQLKVLKNLSQGVNLINFLQFFSSQKVNFWNNAELENTPVQYSVKPQELSQNSLTHVKKFIIFFFSLSFLSLFIWLLKSLRFKIKLPLKHSNDSEKVVNLPSATVIKEARVIALELFFLSKEERVQKLKAFNAKFQAEIFIQLSKIN